MMYKLVISTYANLYYHIFVKKLFIPVIDDVIWYLGNMALTKSGLTVFQSHMPKILV